MEHSANIPKQTSVDEEGVHKELATAATNYFEISFAAEQSRKDWIILIALCQYQRSL